MKTQFGNTELNITLTGDTHQWYMTIDEVAAGSIEPQS